jgi:hypothetical protein
MKELSSTTTKKKNPWVVGAIVIGGAGLLWWIISAMSAKPAAPAAPAKPAAGATPAAIPPFVVTGPNPDGSMNYSFADLSGTLVPNQTIAITGTKYGFNVMLATQNSWAVQITDNNFNNLPESFTVSGAGSY